MKTYELSLDEYQGPLDKLLELIEGQKLEVTEISLAKVTDDFLKYLERLKTEHPVHLPGDDAAQTEVAISHLRILADFIVVAGRLIFIKSKALLPDLALSEEETEDIRDLEARLGMLKALKPAMRMLSERWQKHEHLWSRPYLLNTISPKELDGGVRVFYPSHALTSTTLASSLQGIFALFEKLTMEHETVRDRVISLEAKIKDMIARVRDIFITSFRKLTGSASRGETIVAFLAMLHLAREQIVELQQESHFSDIIIRKTEARNNKSLPAGRQV